ncbi:MAG: helix-hairpin-helix domain-containing protein [Bacteroidota bacterium]
MKSFAFYIAIILLLFSFSGVSQTNPDKIIETNIDNNIENSDETKDIDFSELTDAIEQLTENPINLNIASESEFSASRIFNDIQISNFLYYRQRYGQLISIYELLNINGFDNKSFEAIKPYIIVLPVDSTKQLNFKNIIKYGKTQVIIRGSRVLEEQAGYSNQTDSLKNSNKQYLGSPYKIYSKYRFKYSNNISFGITGEKDAGEAFFKDPQKQGYDFYSAHFFVGNTGNLKALAIGDYQVSFGQGLTLSPGMSFGKGASVINIRKFASGVKSYSSTNENRFFKGIASTIDLGHFDFSVLYSKNKLDASIENTDTLAEEEYFSNFIETGYHNTMTTLENRNTITETIYGTNLNYKYKNVKIGGTAYHQTFDKALVPSKSLYQLFDFSGKENTVYGIDYSYFYQPFSFFGEASTSQNGGKAFLQGFEAHLATFLSVSALYRKYDANYQNLYSAAISSNSSAQNEEGIYIGIQCFPIPHFSFSAYHDMYKYPWLKYRVSSPSYGHDNLFQLDYIPSSKVSMYVRYKNRLKQENSSVETTNIPQLDNIKKSSYRYHFSFQATKNLALKSRIEVSQLENTAKQNGYLIYQDLSYSFPNKPISFSCRYALFDTENYDTRIYAYENDMLYAFSCPAYYYKGSRAYLVMKYSLKKGIDIWFRIAQSYYANKTTISSGLNEIDGNTQTEVKVQVRIKI